MDLRDLRGDEIAIMQADPAAALGVLLQRAAPGLHAAAKTAEGAGGYARAIWLSPPIRGMGEWHAYHFLIGNGIDLGDGQIEVGSRWLRQIKDGHVHQDEVNDLVRPSGPTHLVVIWPGDHGSYIL